MSKEPDHATREGASGSSPAQATISEDKRAGEYLANERTFLAWVRTSVALVSLGFVVTKFSVWLRELAAGLNPQAQPPRFGASLPIGVTLMSLGGLLVVLAARRYWVVNRNILRGKVSPEHGLVVLVTVAVVLLALAMSLYMVVTSERP